MPNDLWSYKGWIIRGLIVFPLILLCKVSKRCNTKFEDKIQRFIDWDYGSEVEKNE